MVKKLESYDLNIDINKSDTDKQVDKYLEIVHEITKIFYEQDLSLDDAQIILESLLHGILKQRFDGYLNIKEIN